MFSVIDPFTNRVAAGGVNRHHTDAESLPLYLFRALLPVECHSLPSFGRLRQQGAASFRVMWIEDKPYPVSQRHQGLVIHSELFTGISPEFACIHTRVMHLGSPLGL